MSKQNVSVGRVVANIFGSVFAGIGRMIATIIMVGVITGCIVASVLTVYILNYIGADEEISLEEIELGYTSIIYANDENGKSYELQRLYFSDNNRIWIGYNDISPHVLEALVAVEDKRFWDHQGVDWRRTFGAFVNMFIPGASRGGGSTITQQLIKNITEDDDYRVDRKVREIFRALNVSQRYTREKILETYLNVVPFGAGTNGIESAAQTYFGKSASELDLAEASAIVGITQKPTAYNPFLYPEANKERQTYVLSQMMEQGLISEDEYERVRNQKLNFKKVEYDNSHEEIQSYFVDHVVETVIADLQEKYNLTRTAAVERLYKGGYRIYTTVDVKMQEYLEDFYKNTDRFPRIHNAEYPQSACTITDINGKMLAVVGYIGEKQGNLVFNRATQATRQPGSSLKPLGPYAVAFESNLITWSSMYQDTPITLTTPGQPSRQWPNNYYTSYRGRMTIAYAIQQSVNTIPAKLVQRLGPETIYSFLHNSLGFHSLVDGAVIDGRSYTDVMLAPMSLGALTYGVTPLEMAGGYQIFANGGYFTEPYCYTEVRDSEDRLILQADTTPRAALSEDTAILMNKILQTVTTQGTGTDASLGNLMPTAGKTGTSENDVDQWFMGMTPYYVCQVWLGYDRENQINEYGVSVPNDIKYSGLGYPPPKLWKSIMEPLQEGLERKEFIDDSDKVVSKVYCNISGDLATSSCGSVSTGWYITRNLPRNCQGHAISSNAEGRGDGGIVTNPNAPDSGNQSPGDDGGIELQTPFIADTQADPDTEGDSEE